VQVAPAVAHEEDRFLSHAGLEIVPRVRHLALVADQQPGASKNPFQLLVVNLLIDVDLAADFGVIEIDEAAQ